MSPRSKRPSALFASPTMRRSARLWRARAMADCVSPSRFFSNMAEKPASITPWESATRAITGQRPLPIRAAPERLFRKAI